MTRTLALTPYLVGTDDGVKRCPRCRERGVDHFNAALARAVDEGLYAGPVFGGYELCAACDGELRTEESALARGLLQSGPLNLPMEFQGATWQTWQPKPGSGAALKAAQAWLKAVDKAAQTAEGDLYLFGPNGVGKTRLACTLLCALHAQGWVTAFLRVPLMLEMLRSGTRTEIFEVYARVGCLVLDEVGDDRGGDPGQRSSLSVLYELRRDEGLPTIWTSNLSLVELADHYQDQRLVSRIAGSAAIVHLTGVDERVERQRRRTASGSKAAQKGQG